MIRLLFGALLAALPVIATADDLPRYDPDAHCETLADGSNRLFNHCINNEQESYAAVVQLWPNTPEQPRQHCANIADSYRLLEHCLKRERDAGGNRQSFSFD